MAESWGLDPRCPGKGRLVLGIDVGTTSVKLCILTTGSPVEAEVILENKSVAFPLECAVRVEEEGFREQSVSVILRTIEKAISSLSRDLLEKVGLISVCGQMHGCVLWTTEARAWNEDISHDQFSSLYTWQDQRCSAAFLATLPEPDSCTKISTGFGCASLFWLTRYKPTLIASYHFSGTIMDLVVSIMCCNSGKPVMSVQNATSWGYFDPRARTWNYARLEESGFPVHLLPEVRASGSVAGELAFPWLGLKQGIPIMVALGDLQCSVFECLGRRENTAVLNVSTSMQLCFEMPNGFTPRAVGEGNEPFAPGVDYFPYFEDTYLAVAASLNGGNVLQAFVDSLQELVHRLSGLRLTGNHIWEQLVREETGRDRHLETETGSKLVVRPTLFGERHDPSLRGSIDNWVGPLGVDQLFEATCKGLVDNLFSMMSVRKVASAGVRRIIGTGSALLRNKVLQQWLERRLKESCERIKCDISISYRGGGDAHVGAALVGAKYIGENNQKQMIHSDPRKLPID